jgi:hypothetical protein
MPPRSELRRSPRFSESSSTVTDELPPSAHDEGTHPHNVRSCGSIGQLALFRGRMIVPSSWAPAEYEGAEGIEATSRHQPELMAVADVVPDLRRLGNVPNLAVATEPKRNAPLLHTQEESHASQSANHQRRFRSVRPWYLVGPGGGPSATRDGKGERPSMAVWPVAAVFPCTPALRARHSCQQGPTSYTRRGRAASCTPRPLVPAGRYPTLSRLNGP